jgi:catechol 2,3-dioxygenase-like lactoylglutathione lyase family enzyme
MAKLGHVHLPVSNLTTSRTFYTHTMGFTADYDDGEMISYSDVGLVLDQAADGAVIGTGTIVAFACDDADAEYRRLGKRGAELGDAPADRPWGVRSFYLSDPDGHELEFEQRLG